MEAGLGSGFADILGQARNDNATPAAALWALYDIQVAISHGQSTTRICGRGR
jgi:hypothetical protein